VVLHTEGDLKRIAMEFPMPEQTITHLVSDCDGVLIDSEAVALQALLAGVAAFIEPARHALLPDLIKPRLGLKLEPLLMGLFQELGLPCPDAAVLAGLRAEVELACDTHLRAIPGVAAAMAAIPLPKAVASNSSRARVSNALARTGMAPLFGDRIYTPDIVGHAKPHPGVYLAAVKGFGVAAANCAAVEDSVTGVTAASAAGLLVLGFTGGGHVPQGQAAMLIEAGAVATFDDMAKLPDLLAAYSAGSPVPRQD
jgi:HAD superfamily hydrolase (TIGR01509 family)